MSPVLKDFGKRNGVPFIRFFLHSLTPSPKRFNTKKLSLKVKNKQSLQELICYTATEL